ncbi:hypothetical protein [Corynebacterium sp. Marseille-Q4381]|uniref:hypothetical protein n=1 Tax=Corynebacterium sp. Marseille-Q4381 TaxID=3121597 RepID=UPI002FE66A81
MEDIDVKSLKPVAAIACALALASCSAGQITQTSSQVAAVDGASVFTEDGALSVQDVTLILEENGQAALKFVATNQDTSMKDHTLQSATVDGTPVNLGSSQKITYNCVLVGDTASSLERMPQTDSDCTQYVATSVENKNFAYGGNVPVKFNFDTGSIEVTATVSAPIVASGQVDRDPSK